MLPPAKMSRGVTMGATGLLMMLTDAMVTREVATEYYEALQSQGRLLLAATGTTTLRVFATVDYWPDQGLLMYYTPYTLTH